MSVELGEVIWGREGEAGSVEEEDCGREMEGRVMVEIEGRLGEELEEVEGRVVTHPSPCTRGGCGASSSGLRVSPVSLLSMTIPWRGLSI